MIDQLAVCADYLPSLRVGNENRHHQMNFDRLVRCRLGCSFFTSQLTIEYTDSTYTPGFSIIDRIRLSLPTGCHCGDFPNNNPYYISSMGSCCGCRVGTSYHRIHKKANRSGGTRWNLLTKNCSARFATPSASITTPSAPKKPIPTESNATSTSTTSATRPKWALPRSRPCSPQHAKAIKLALQPNWSA
jgi:hypothetical protein